MRKYLKKFFQWVFSYELGKIASEIRQCEKERKALKEQADRVSNLLSNLDISVDLHHYSPSWAVISLQGQKTDYIKFIQMNDRTIMDIDRVLRQFERSKVDCSPMEHAFLRKNKTFKI
ncbi:hypothetical protein [Dysgonomonas sp. HGC4]|uniref:hypothetical protein n=1 Tax=Dysgonomonas sp. HGC4 TaxID=1658009 RepID=UPI000681D253|nr:hypothetical protein [Dysgonomonas sp. HGC4]MBD8348563.1 hypothetical protein [Dysgonomonas sp. HGC4]